VAKFGRAGLPAEGQYSASARIPTAQSASSRCFIIVSKFAVRLSLSNQFEQVGGIAIPRRSGSLLREEMALPTSCMVGKSATVMLCACGPALGLQASAKLLAIIGRKGEGASAWENGRIVHES
jgi:hypothetical protein